jgi:hypothetical protein
MTHAVRLVYAIQILLALSVFGATDPAGVMKEIPFQFRDGFIWIEVTLLDAPKPLHFLLDTGAQVSVIDTSTAHRLGMKRGRAVTVAGVGATTTGCWTQAVDARAGRVQLPRNYLMLDLSKLSEACTNSTVDGIIGADFFHDRIVQVDFQQQAVRILHKPPAGIGMQLLPLKVRHCGMLVPVQVDNAKSEWVRLDTGCASALQWVTASVRAEGCTKRVAVALTSFSVPVTQMTVALGAVRFEKVPTDLQEKEIFPGEKGLLGNGLLSRFQTVTIDAKRKEVILGAVSTTNR